MKTQVLPIAILILCLVQSSSLQVHHGQASSELKEQSQLDFGPIREQLNLDNKSSTQAPYPDSALPMDGPETINYELICFMAEILEERSNLLFSLENSDEMDLLTNLMTGDRSRTGLKLGKMFIPRVG